ncbi:MAG: cation diffusion facilitator family transporter [Thermoplasmata archaeon]
MGFLPDLGDASDPRTRARYGYFQSTVAIVVNMSLFSSKIFIASFLGSVAVLTDAFNQLGDVGISLMILLAFRYAGKEADREHPFGHGRLEDVAALLVAAFLVFVAVLLLLQSVRELFNPSIRGSLVFALILGVLAGVKEILARFSFAIAERIDSDVVRGDAWNHRYDAMLTGAIALAIYMTSWSGSLRILDPLFGIIVSGIILYTGGRLLRSAGDRLLGRAPSEVFVRHIMDLASTLPGVRKVHDISVHDYGFRKAVALTVDVDNHLSIEEAHEIASGVEIKIREELKAEATVHVEPVARGLGSETSEDG